MDATWDTPFAKEYDRINKINITLASHPDIDSPTRFLAKIEIPDDAKTIARAGTWILQVAYLQDSRDGVVISTTADMGRELNFPLREINLNSVYWIIQKHMQRRMDCMNSMNGAS